MADEIIMSEDVKKKVDGKLAGIKMTKARVLGIQIQPEIGNKEANLDKVKNLLGKMHGLSLI